MGHMCTERHLYECDSVSARVCRVRCKSFGYQPCLRLTNNECIPHENDRGGMFSVSRYGFMQTRGPLGFIGTLREEIQSTRTMSLVLLFTNIGRRGYNPEPRRARLLIREGIVRTEKSLIEMMAVSYLVVCDLTVLSCARSDAEW